MSNRNSILKLTQAFRIDEPSREKNRLTGGETTLGRVHTSIAQPVDILSAPLACRGCDFQVSGRRSGVPAEFCCNPTTMKAYARLKRCIFEARLLLCGEALEACEGHHFHPYAEPADPPAPGPAPVIQPPRPVEGGFWEITCCVCGRLKKVRRRDTRYCSGACRTLASRRKRAGHA